MFYARVKSSSHSLKRTQSDMITSTRRLALAGWRQFLILKKLGCCWRSHLITIEDDTNTEAKNYPCCSELLDELQTSPPLDVLPNMKDGVYKGSLTWWSICPPSSLYLNLFLSCIVWHDTTIALTLYCSKFSMLRIPGICECGFTVLALV